MGAAAATVRRAPATILVAACAGLAGLLGLVAAAAPLVAIVLAAGMAFTLATFAELLAGVWLFAVLTYVDVIGLGAVEELTLTKFAAVVMVLAWLAGIAVGRHRDRSLARDFPWLTVAVTGFVLWTAASSLWADDPGVALRAAALRYAPSAVLVGVIYAAVREPRHVRALYAALILGALASAVFGMVLPPEGIANIQARAEGRLSGATADANALAAQLLVAAVLAGTLRGLLPRGSPRRALATLAIPLALVGFLATQSRSGLIALALAGATALALQRRGRAPLVAGGLAAVALCAVYFGLVAPAAWERVTSTETSGRGVLWTVAGRMIADQPVLGVGADNYRLVSVQYLLRPGATDTDIYVIDRPLPAHNIFLEVLADLGLVGLALYLAVVGICLAAAVRAARRPEGRDRELAVLAKGLVVALVALLATGFFASEQAANHVWLLLAIAPALLTLPRLRAP